MIGTLAALWVGVGTGTASLVSWGLGVWRGLRPFFSRADFVLLSNVKGLGLDAFFVVEAGVELGSPSPNAVSDCEGKEEAGA